MVIGETFQLYEGLLLLLLAAGLVPLTAQYARYRNRWFYSAYLCFTAAGIFTNVEAFVLPRLFNYMEHSTLLFASFLYWMSAARSADAVVDTDINDVLAKFMPDERDAR